MQCESVSLLSPITALQFVGDFLLSGEGAIINLYTLNSTNDYERRFYCNALQNYCIHGIKPCWPAHKQTSRPQLAVFGAKGLIVFELNTCAKDPKLQKMGQLLELHDWIWDLQWLENDGELMYFGLALGHNSVVLCDYKAGRTLREVHCDVKCILYSACFVGHTWAELVLISGTVFNQLVLWRMEGPTNEDGRVQTERRISGHSGVIFSIHYMEKNGILASASDDRSIRLWKVGNLCEDVKGDGEGAGSVQCLLQLYGHQSRVWSVQLLEDHIISVGEDSACIVWSYNGDIINCFKGHKGRSVRAMAVNEDKGWLVTGGADSGIRLWKIQDKKSEDVVIFQLKFGGTGKIETPKALTLVDSALLLVMTDAGSIYSYCLLSGKWKLILEDPSYQSYSLLVVTRLVSGCVICAIGNINGRVKIFLLSAPEDCVENQVHQGKVHSLGWASREGQARDKCHLFSSGADGVMIWREVSCKGNRLASVAEKCRYCLPLCKHRWHTSVTFLPERHLLVCGDRRGSLLLYSCAEGDLGERQRLSEESADVAGSENTIEESLEGRLPVGSTRIAARFECREPVSALPGLHGKLGVTSVLFHDGFVYSTGRDGYYRQLQVEDGGLKLLRSHRACKGMDWIERLLLTPGGNFLVLGFHSTNLVLWNVKTSEKVLCIPCGGGHRSWSYTSSPGNEIFTYIKSGDILICQRDLSNSSRAVIKDCMHGREFTCVRFVERFKVSADGPVSIVATSSEDTTVNVLAIYERSGHVTKLTTICDHISSVRTMAITKSRRSDHGDNRSSSAALLFSAGGRAELQCSRLLIRHGDVSAPVSCQVEHLVSHRLAEDWEHKKNRHRMLKMDPETRYMSVVVVDAGMNFGKVCRPSSHLLAAACSDGSVRLFLIDECQRNIVLLAESFYHQRCVLKLQTFIYQQATRGHRAFLCSAATDGRIAFWDVSRTIERVTLANILQEGVHHPWGLESPCLVLKAHQCGVSGLHIRALEEGRYLLASGGDDNAIRVWVVSVESAGDDDGTTGVGSSGGQCASAHGAEGSAGVSLQVAEGPRVDSAHAAHITGVRIVSSRLLVSVSIDQRLTHWQLNDQGLHFLHSTCCQVADIAELESWEGVSPETHLFAVCGDGLQVLKSQQQNHLVLQKPNTADGRNQK
ncbi:WD repeat-containing protein 6 isoform X1 [Scyliorhinus canicula]|uniref:WD repeat-containing protein 6 isoform X1 n=1 Tax=Scyliorhinus canicula TaxID=7830 RepID=UPI0018F411BC|nr:WD repeat-containing protein 6 isoform X1 [Scyliorhinus canicula]XP_038668168.1 WD repeat-containing protein 6 isoform X1 [Scyliorhinus canicula]XP_038668169.1 WD repeat-containing protein 6 isoform X1 [Scyliorhinus canicula]